ncbi:MAG: hypothetical protein Q9M26_01630 [Mariprofundales bacterium]|nr:hypothetical protein [Mariprofundales bacterium]
MRLGMAWLALLLLAACSQPEISAERKQLIASDDPGAVALRAYCNTCHAAPMPKRHRAAEWPSVVARMELHRMHRSYEKIGAGDRAVLLHFLQAGAKL